MLEVMMVLTVLNTAVAVAALVMTAMGRGGHLVRHGGAVPPSPQGEGKGDEEKHFKLSDKKMQEGIANLLGYEVGKGGEGEDR